MEVLPTPSFPRRTILQVRLERVELAMELMHNSQIIIIECMLKLIIFENNWERMVLYDDWKVKYGLHNNNITKIMSTQQDQKYELLISALRANQRCKKERQNFNLIKSSVSGQIEPSVSRNSAIDLLDCFNRVNNPNILKKEREEAMNALRNGLNAEAAINAYVLAD